MRYINFAFSDGRAHVVGVVSRGDDCAGFNQPGIYTDVSKYLDWIEKHTKDGSCPESSKTGGGHQKIKSKEGAGIQDKGPILPYS